MNRIEVACYSLLASALVLAGLLVAKLPSSSADAAMLAVKDDLTLMTARTQNSAESLFVLDSRNEKLLIYGVTVRGTTGRMELKNYVDLAKTFSAGAHDPKKTPTP